MISSKQLSVVTSFGSNPQTSECGYVLNTKKTLKIYASSQTSKVTAVVL